MPERSINLLVFSTLFPHAGEPTLGIFVENRLQNLLEHEEGVTATVIAPVPWFPFRSIKLFGAYGRAARADKVEVRGGVKIYHPRYLVIPKVGMLLTPFFLYLSALLCVKRLVRDGYQFDLIDAHYLYPDGVAAAKLARHLKVPFVATARGSDVTQIGKIAKPRAAIVRSLEQAFHVITVSENLRRDLVEMGVMQDKITTLRNGVDLTKFQETRRVEGRAQFSKGPILLFAGWLIPRKRLDLVLEVTSLLPEVTTIVVGDGPLMPWCKEHAGLKGVDHRVMFMGQKTPDQMPEFFSMADVLLLPSDREGWANVLLESMACGTPVVSRAIGGAPDLISTDVAGRVVDSDDPKLLAEAVSDLLDKLPERKDVRDFATRFDWSDTSVGQYEIFKRAVEKRTET